MMKKGIIGLSFFLVIAGLGSVYFVSHSSKVIAKEIVVYQSRTCGCCKKWVKHLEDNGYSVKSEFMDDVTEVKVQLNLPMKMASCHTALIDGYIVEGHVPATAINKLLTERPAVKGIAVPGMPMGSPGMEGSYKEAYDVLAFDDKGNVEKYMNF